MKSKHFIPGILLLIAGVVMTSGCKSKKASAELTRAMPIPEVEVVQVSLQAMPWKHSYPARVESPRSVEIRPRVSGILISRSYVEGDHVEAGDELFRIDPIPYELAADRAKADCERALAQERQAQREKDRVMRLFSTEAVSEKQRDDALSAFELAQAGRMAAEASLKQAELNLEYTRVTSPIRGATTLETLNEGSLVSSSNILTTVTQLDPLHIRFSIPEGDPALDILKSNAVQEKSALVLTLRNGQPYPLKGDLSFIDSGVDPKTGGVRVRADFANPDGVLLPGQFIRVSFENLLLPPMTVIPEQAVLMTAMGAMVYVVDENNTIQPRPVVLGPVLESGQLIKSGLNEGDRVIFTSLIRLRPGMQVKAIEKGAEAHAYSAPAKAPQAEADEAPQIEASAAESSAPIED